MTNEQLDYVRSSLIRAANTIDPGNAVNTLYGAMLFLTKTLRRAETDVAFANEESLTYRRDVCGAMLAQIRHFLEMYHALPAHGSADPNAAALERQCTEAEQSLQGCNTHTAKLEADKKRLEDDIASMKDRIKAAEASIKPLQESFANLEKQYTQLCEERNSYTGSKADDLNARLDHAREELAEARRLHNARARDLESLLADIRQQRKANEEVQAQIDAEPATLRGLHESYNTLRLHLQEIRSAEESCSVEKQDALRKEIDALSGQADTLRADHALVSGRHTAMKAVVDSLQQSADSDEQALLRTVTNVLEEVEGHLHTQEEALAGARSKANTFQERLQACDEERRRYAGWLDSVIEPLESMCEKAGLTRTENSELYRTFDPAATQTVRKLMQETGENLEKLDDILRSGMQSTTADHRLTRRRAETSERYARNHS